MGSFSITHWLILLVVVVVVFGTSKLKNAGKDLGGAVKGFKEAVKDEEAEHTRKHRVLDHDASTRPSSAQAQQSTKVPNSENTGTKIDDADIKSTPVDDKHEV